MNFAGMELNKEALNKAFYTFAEKWDDPRCGGKVCLAHAINAYLQENVKQNATRDSGGSNG